MILYTPKETGRNEPYTPVIKRVADNGEKKKQDRKLDQHVILNFSNIMFDFFLTMYENGPYSSIHAHTVRI